MQYSFGHSRVSLQCQLILVVAVIKCITASGHDSPVRSETCTNLLQRKNATSSTAAPLLISLHSVTSERACWLFWDCQALKKKNTPAGEQFIFLCCPNDRTFSSRSRARQTTDVNTLHFCMSAECKLSPFHCICPNMLPYSVASCREAFLRSLGHLATSQAKCSSTPKMSSSLSLKAIFLTAVAFMFSTHNWCSCWKEKVGNFFFPKFNINSSVLLLV